MRARTFYAGVTGLPVAEVNVPVVGGHAGVTILPLFSQATPSASLTDDQIDKLTKRTQDGGTEVVQAKAGKVTASKMCSMCLDAPLRVGYFSSYTTFSGNQRESLTNSQ